MNVVRKIVIVIVIALAVVLGIGGASVIAATPTHVLQANRAAAVAAADGLLSGVVLPAGSSETSTEPAGDGYLLAHSFELAIYAAEVDQHEFWTTTASLNAVIASFKAHLPMGAKSSGSGSDYSNGTETSVFASYSLPAVDAPALGPRSLTVNAVELTRGGTGVRADAFVRYAAPRLPAQRIPARAGVLEVTRTRLGQVPALSLTVTDRSTVRRIGAIVDSLPFFATLHGVAFSCPAMMLAPTDTFTFRASPSGPVLAQVSEPADWPTIAEPCYITTLEVRGHREPGLLEGGRLLRQAGAILGVKLATRP